MQKKIFLCSFFIFFLTVSKAVFSGTDDIFHVDANGEVSLCEGVISNPNRFLGMLHTGTDSLKIWKGSKLVAVAGSELFEMLWGAVWVNPSIIDGAKNVTIRSGDLIKGDSKTMCYVASSDWPIRLIERLDEENKSFHVMLYSTEWTSKIEVTLTRDKMNGIDTVVDISSLDISDVESVSTEKNQTLSEIMEFINYVNDQ